MKTIKLFLTAVIVSALVVSCGSKEGEGKSEGDNTEKSGSALDGKWVIKRATGAMADMNIGVIYEFDGDKLTFGSASFKNPGTTKITDKTFSFKAEGNDLEFIYDYSFDGDTLVVSMQNSGQTFYMVKE